MSERATRYLVSLWLFLSCWPNVATLRNLIRVAFQVFANLYAGLDRWRDAQFLLAMGFVLVVIALLLSGKRLGQTLSVVLLLGSCCTIAGVLFLELVETLQGHPHHPSLLGWLAICLFLALNVLCLRALGFHIKAGGTDPSTSSG